MSEKNIVKKRELKFIGIDWWSRPVFTDKKGFFFGSTEILYDGGEGQDPNDWVKEKVSEKNIQYFGTDMDDDPDGTYMKPDSIIIVKQFSDEPEENH